MLEKIVNRRNIILGVGIDRGLNTTMKYIDVNDEMKRNAVELV